LRNYFEFKLVLPGDGTGCE
jgi:hypothetical protein